MPVFLSDEEFAGLRHDGAAVAERADAFIRDLQRELETLRAHSDAAAITAEQTCSLLENKFLSLSSDFSLLQSENAQLQSSLDHSASDLAEVQSQKHQLHLQIIEKDGEIGRLKTEVSEFHKSKRQLLELVEQKDSEISEKNLTIKSYLDKIVNLTDNAAEREARLNEIEAELARSQAACTRLSQEKELIERHNTWLNDELTAKVDELIELRRKHADVEADLSSKLTHAQRQFDECSSSLKWNKDRVVGLEMKLTSLQEELRSTKEVAAANDEQLSAELSIANKLVELYKESSEEWSKKAGDLEGVIKALETHLSQVQNDYSERLEKEVSARHQFEKEAAELKVKLDKCEAEIETSRKANELNLLPLTNFTTQTWISSVDTNDMLENDHMIVPRIPAGVSGTALAASLLRDGWSLAKMYAKYQEAVDALRHEQLGRKESEAVLQRVLYELEEKAELILDERAEHERMVEAYSLINQKLQISISEQENLEKTIQELKVDLRRHERDNNLAQKGIADLQKQVTVLLKECRDIQIRCGSSMKDIVNDASSIVHFEMTTDSDAEKVISERLLTFKDINGLVEQNAQLRSLVRNLSDQIENKEYEFKEKLEMELKKHTEEAASRVTAVLQRAEEQGRMIESLHTSVAMYKRLYEEEHKLHSTPPLSIEAPPDGRTSLKLLLEGSQEAAKRAQEKAAERVKCLEEELEKSRMEITSLRLERDKLALESNFARERLDSFMKEFEHQRTETNGVLARNVEFSQIIVDYQRKLRESSESLHAAEELSRKLNMEVSVLKNEKEMLVNAEKRALDEVRNLSQRVHRLQVSLDTIQSTEQVREEARAAERRKQEEHTKQIQREWAEARKELQEERDKVRALTLDRERTLKNAMRQVEEMQKDLANAWSTVRTAETRAAVAEAKLSDLEKKIKPSDIQDIEMNGAAGSSSFSSSEVLADLRAAKEEIEKLREEAQAYKDHMLQYKNIAQVNEDALKQMERAHENYKVEAEKLKRSLEAELLSLREKVSELENESSLKSEEVASAAAGKEEALSSALTEIGSLKEANSAKASQIVTMEIQISSLKEDLEKEHQRWCSAQANYQRHVILLSETIQELNKTSKDLGLLQDEASELRKMVYVQKRENSELKTKWEIEKAVIEQSKNDAEKKYNELNEQNKILHSRLEALHIQLAEKDRFSSGLSGGSAGSDTSTDSGLQSVINYLRRSREIAETEISLLKQEKLRLQSQLESALKAAETAESALQAERATSRSIIFTEEEMKSFQQQAREMTLLRESNAQLREENKHNFEECQKLREVAQKANAETQNLERLIKESQIQVEACKKEIEIQKLEKENLEKRVSELLERCRNIDMNEYNRLKDDVQQMQENLKAKDSQIEENKRLLSERQETISLLEQDLSNCRLELTEREKRLNESLQAEASLKSEVERQKKMVFQLKRRLDCLSKEKEELSRENQALTKQLEELKQAKRSGGDSSSDQAMKEEKDTRIQILEKHIERLREELKAEKGKRVKNEKLVKNSYDNVEQEKTKFVNELEKHKQASMRLADELEKLKPAKESLPEGISLTQQPSGTALDDRVNAYVLAVENFEKTARAVSIELGALAVPTDAPNPPVDSTVAATTGLVAPAQPPGISSSVGPATSVPAKSTEESEKRYIAPKANVESRKMPRRLVRSRLVKQGEQQQGDTGLVKREEQQGDTEMSEIEGPNNGGKTAPPSDAETQGNVSSLPLTQTLARKRLASSSSAFGSHEESVAQVETGPDVAAPLTKKSKGSDSLPVSGEGQASSTLENLDTLPVIEESIDIGDMTQASNEEVAIDAEKEEADTTEDKAEEPRELQLAEASQVENSQDDNIVLEENLEGAGGKEMVSDEGAHDLADLENLQPMIETGSEREEGELVPDAAELEGTVDVAPSPELVGEGQPEPSVTPAASPTRVDDEAIGTAAVDFGEINSQETQNDEKNDEVEVPEEAAEGSEKSNDVNDQAAVEIDQVAEAASVAPESTSAATTSEVAVSKQNSPRIVTESEEVKQVSPISSTSTTINLTERARQRAMLRQAGQAGVISPSLARGRTRAAPRGRGARGGRRGGRGPTTGEQA
ncbi:nuclear-pore anchor isoform X2 [Morus notabilis]|uniref:nuclear-pore anchor isoform X2 n=1 Tax=Morus notabilis TaxID=981085 RepID=UPI000CED22B8|nr:nuclear-pore anchor isoform X2 [Morus notabilis]